ncbi:hypothetical protein LARV_00613 [Longilinea arvoryzae]|uniref:Uncharacterized protein n=1 Tax=Longilinea arvoryzae TaxID=360412 RepID=A0A0S7BCG1_9CHLR|nr:hypothetical protein LARV_00613 [Longilinea arvoryzae]
MVSGFPAQVRSQGAAGICRIGPKSRVCRFAGGDGSMPPLGQGSCVGRFAGGGGCLPSWVPCSPGEPTFMPRLVTSGLRGKPRSVRRVGWHAPPLDPGSRVGRFAGGGRFVPPWVPCSPGKLTFMPRLVTSGLRGEPWVKSRPSSFIPLQPDLRKSPNRNLRANRITGNRFSKKSNNLCHNG